MALVLTIENERSLANGGPVSIRLDGERGIDIGRSANVDWTLPDPTRFISGRHCEVRFRDGGFWLNDLSTNGTFLNDSARRVQAPYRLRDGDRLTIGSYVIAVALEQDSVGGAAEGGEPLAPLAAADAARLDAEIAQAIASESAEAGAGPVGTGTRPQAIVPTLDPRAREARAWSQPERADDARPRGEDAGAPGEAATAEEFLRRFAKGAGIPEHIFARQDGLKVAEELGALMRLSVEDLTQLLNARFKARRFARASSQTMIQALDNNPLKFAPTAADALKIMFGPRTSGYLDARRAFEGAFTDLKTHQIMTFAAMQQAVRMLAEDLDPKAIESAAGADQGLSALFGGRKARLWDLYVARWQAKTLRHEDGLVDAFMLYFAQCYDQAKGGEESR